jgi:ribosomal protein S18 acetylase RimI-like enzyme
MTHRTKWWFFATRIRSTTTRGPHHVITIRRFHIRDLDAVVAVEHKAFLHDPLPSPAFVQYEELYPSLFFVAEDAGELVGYAIVARAETVLDEGLVISLAVDPSHQGRGVGRALMQRAIDAACEAGIRTLELTVAPENVAAVHLYQTLGFDQIGHILKDYFGEGEDRLRMRKELPALCVATDPNLQMEAATSVTWSNLVTGIAGAALAGLIAVKSSNPVAYWYVLLTLLGALYASQFYANVSGVVARLRRTQDPERLLTIGNAFSEYLAFYPLVLALPLLIWLLSGNREAAIVATIADLAMFAFYQLSNTSVEARQGGRRSSISTLVLVSFAAIAQVAAAVYALDLLLYAVALIATVALLALTVRGVRSNEH